MKALSTLLAASVAATAMAQASENPFDGLPWPAPTLGAMEPDDDEYDTVTEYYDDCSTSSSEEYPGTVTNTATETLPCDECEHSTTEPGVWTTYTTAYIEICSTGETSKTYTITESCTEENQPRPSTYVPSGFTVSTLECEVCEHPTVTLTTPCEETTEAPESVPTEAPPAPTPTPVVPGTTAPPQPGPTAPAAPHNTHPAPAPAPPSSVPGSPHGYPAHNTSTVVCPGCGEAGPSTTHPPIAIAKASSISLNGVMVAIWAVVAGIFATL